MDTVLLGRDAVFPLVIVGYPANRADPWHQLAMTQPIYIFDHQLGGFSCLHVAMLGIGLRLVDNLDRASRDPRGLIDALCSMGEVGEAQFGVRYREAEQLLDGWFETYGELMTEPDVCELDALWQQHYAGFPRLIRGHEALVVSEPLTDASYFASWVATRFIAPSGTEANFWNTESPPGLELGPRCADMLPDLLALGGGEPTAFLLWENSD